MRVVPPLLAFAFVAAGCHKAPALAGRWKETTEKGTALTFEFKPEGPFTFEVKGDSTVVYSGDAKLEGKTLTLTFKDAALTGATEEAKKVVKARVKADLAKPAAFSAAFPTDDQLVLSGADPKLPGGNAVFAREKGAG